MPTSQPALLGPCSNTSQDSDKGLSQVKCLCEKHFLICSRDAINHTMHCKAKLLYGYASPYFSKVVKFFDN